MQNQMKNKDAFILISVPVELLEEADICAGDALQMYVDDGCIVIEPIYNDDGTCLVGNEESKLRGMDGNRRIGDGSSVMAGPFFVCGDSGETFRSLTDEEVTRYMARFAEPEDISPEEVEADMGFMIYPM